MKTSDCWNVLAAVVQGASKERKEEIQSAIGGTDGLFTLLFPKEEHQLYQEIAMCSRNMKLK